MAWHLAAQYSRTYGSFPGAPALRGSLYGSGFASEYAACAQASLPTLVYMWLLPTASLENKVMATEAPSSALSLCKGQMAQGSAENPSHELPEPSAPWGRNSALGDAAGTLVSPEIANAKGEKASILRLRTAGAAPGADESHFVSPPGRFEWSRRDGASDVRTK